MIHSKHLHAVLAGSMLFAAVLLTGCGSGKEEKEAANPAVVTVADAEVVVGTTKLSEIEAKGYTVSYDKAMTQLISKEEVMPARTYDVGVYFGKDGTVYGMVQCLNDEMEKEIPYMESKINNIEVYFSEGADPYGPPLYFDSVKVDGEDFKGMTADQVLAAVKDTAKEEPSVIPYPEAGGGGTAVISFSRNNCYYMMNFDMETSVITNATIEMFHSNF